MNKSSATALSKTLIALVGVALLLILAALLADSDRRPMSVITTPAGGVELADLLAQQTTPEETSNAAALIAVAPDISSTPLSTPTLVATSSASAAPHLPGIRAQPLIEAINIRRGPGTSFEVTGILRQSETVPVLARNGAGDWYLIQMDNGLAGWVAANVVAIEGGSLGAISIAATIPAPPTATATATAVAPTAIPSSPPEDYSPTREPVPTVTPAPSPTAGVPPTATPNPYP